MRVNLIRPKTDEEYASLKQVYSSFPPSVGLCCIGSVIKRECEVKIYDGNLSVPFFDAEIIGIQDWVTSHKGALKLAKEAKKQNPDCLVVLGGVNASHLAERILCNHKYVDYVVHGSGEEALLGLVKKHPPKDIPNLCYRENGFVKINQGEILRSPLFDLEQVVQWECDAETPFPIAGIRGCIKAARKGICGYCSLENEKVGIMHPKDFWQQIRILKEKYGITYFFETGDEFVVGKYPQILFESRPEDLSDISFRIYSYPETLAQAGIIEILAELNVQEVYIGIETINKKMLNAAGRDYNQKGISKIFKRFSRRGIKAMTPFMFGLPGETNETAQQNFDFSQSLLERYPEVIKMMQYSLVVPIAGSRYFTIANANSNINRSYNLDKRNLGADTDFDYNLLTELFIKEYSRANVDFLRRLVEEGKQAVSSKKILTSTFIGI